MKVQFEPLSASDTIPESISYDGTTYNINQDILQKIYEEWLLSEIVANNENRLDVVLDLLTYLRDKNYSLKNNGIYITIKPVINSVNINTYFERYTILNKKTGIMFELELFKYLDYYEGEYKKLIGCKRSNIIYTIDLNTIIDPNYVVIFDSIPIDHFSYEIKIKNEKILDTIKKIG